MGRASQRVDREAILEYLKYRGFHDATILKLEILGDDDCDIEKGFGYGRPLRIDFFADGKDNTFVVRTMSADPFGHEWRSDRIANMVQAYDTFDDIPSHIDAHDVGVIGPNGQLKSIPNGEPFLVSNFIEGTLYAKKLERLASKAKAEVSDLNLAQRLGEFLVDVHSQQRPPQDYRRHLRDVIGSGEGIFGQVESFEPSDVIASPARLQELEKLLIPWRWSMRANAHRCRRSHGDFHPFNILVTPEDNIAALDASRGGLGDPADDVVCLSLNYLFFSLEHQGRFDGPFLELWNRFFSSYLENTQDTIILKYVAPYFTWRTLVLINPLWYPNISPLTRETLFESSIQLLKGAPFDPFELEPWLWKH